jgi:hypothetical protein
VRRVPFSCFACSDSFSAVPRVSGLVFGGTEGVVSRFSVLRSRTHFRRYQGCWVPFSCFARLDSFSAVSSGSGPVFMFCTPVLVFGGTEGVGSRFHVLRSQTHFRRYRGRPIPFSCFAHPGLVFGGTEGVVSRFHVLRARSCFRQYRVCLVLFSCFVRPFSFSAVPRAWGPVFMLCVTGVIFGGTEGVGSRFHVFRALNRFRRYRGRHIHFSCFTLQDSFSAVTSASGPVFMFCVPGLVFSGTEGVGYHFHFVHARTRFRRNRGLQVPFSCFALSDSFSTVPRVLSPFFMFCTLGLVFGGVECVGSRFQVFHS